MKLVAPLPCLNPAFHPRCRIFHEGHLKAEIIRRSLAGLDHESAALRDAVFFALNGSQFFPTDSLDQLSTQKPT